jgi:hypothetical protein
VQVERLLAPELFVNLDSQLAAAGGLQILRAGQSQDWSAPDMGVFVFGCNSGNIGSCVWISPER